MKFKVGEVVRCVDNGPWHLVENPEPPVLELGKVYRVLEHEDGNVRVTTRREVVQHSHDEGTVPNVEVAVPGWFNARRFVWVGAWAEAMLTKVLKGESRDSVAN